MSFKSLLSTLIKASIRNNFPTNSRIDIEASDQGDYTAPTNGYVSLMSPNGGYVRLSIASGNVGTQIDLLDNNKAISLGWYAIAKGNTCSWRLTGGQTGTLRFVEAIGGGLTRLFKRLGVVYGYA